MYSQGAKGRTKPNDVPLMWCLRQEREQPPLLSAPRALQRLRGVRSSPEGAGGVPAGWGALGPPELTGMAEPSWDPRALGSLTGGSDGRAWFGQGAELVLAECGAGGLSLEQQWGDEASVTNHQRQPRKKAAADTPPEQMNRQRV